MQVNANQGRLGICQWVAQGEGVRRVRRRIAGELECEENHRRLLSRMTELVVHSSGHP